MKRYIIAIIAIIISTLSMSITANAYTREELEAQVRKDLSAAYDTYNMNKEKLAEAQNTLNGLEDQKAAALKELEYQVKHDEITDSEYKKKKKEVENNFKDLKKAYEKQVEGLEEMIENFDKEFEKRMKEIDDKMEEQEKKADKAEEKLEKLSQAQYKCLDMVATSAKVQECLDEASKKYGLSDDETEALSQRNKAKAEQAKAAEEAANAAYQQMLQDSMIEEGPEEEEIVLREDGTYGSRESTSGTDGGTGVGTESSTEGTNGTESSSSTTGGADGTSSTTGGTSSTSSSTGTGSGSYSGGFSGGSSSGLFSNLINSGAEIFSGMKSIIFAVSGLGIVGVAIGGFFGSLNWKWLSAIIIGLMVIAGAGGILEYIAGSGTASSINIQDTLINAG